MSKALVIEDDAFVVSRLEMHEGVNMSTHECGKWTPVEDPGGFSAGAGADNNNGLVAGVGSIEWPAIFIFPQSASCLSSRIGSGFFFNQLRSCLDGAGGFLGVVFQLPHETFSWVRYLVVVAELGPLPSIGAARSKGFPDVDLSSRSLLRRFIRRNLPSLWEEEDIVWVLEEIVDAVVPHFVRGDGLDVRMDIPEVED